MGRFLQSTTAIILLVLAYYTSAQRAPRYNVRPVYRMYRDLATAAQEQHAHEHQEQNSAPMPYSFEYSATDPEGSHSHSSNSDGKTVTGEYSIQLSDGRMRKVKYTADENGYRAEIITNELGTESKNPADVTIESSAPTGAQSAMASPPAPAAVSAMAMPAQYSTEALSGNPSASYARPVYVHPIYFRPASPYQRQYAQPKTLRRQPTHRWYDSRFPSV